MKKIYLIFLTIFACAFLASTDAGAQEQEFPWPDLGTPLVIEGNGPPGVLETTINGDTAADGSRLHNHYILKRGQLYLYWWPVNNVEWELMITAEEGDGPLPIIQAAGVPPTTKKGDDEPQRFLIAQGNVYIKDLHIRGWGNDDLPTDNATFRLNSNDIIGVVKNCIFDYNRQNVFRLNGQNLELYIENTLVFNQGNATNLANGETIHFRDNYADLVLIRNSSFTNNTDAFSDHTSLGHYGTFIMDHNTIVNTGRWAADLGKPDSLVWTNNLIINPMCLGDASGGDRSKQLEPRNAFEIDTLTEMKVEGTDTSYVFVPLNATWKNNWIYVDPGVEAFLPDSSNSAAEFMFDPILDDIVKAEATNKIIKEAFPFTNRAQNTTADYQGFIVDYYNPGGTLTPAQMPGGPFPHSTPNRPEPTDVDFGYPTSHAAYTGAADGKPLGDLNWHPDFAPTGIRDKLAAVNMKIYPNPVGDYFVISLDMEMNRIDIVNVLGQRVNQINIRTSREVLVNSSDLGNGIYIVRCYNNNTLIGTHKIMK